MLIVDFILYYIAFTNEYPAGSFDRVPGQHVVGGKRNTRSVETDGGEIVVKSSYPMVRIVYFHIVFGLNIFAVLLKEP